MFSLVRLAQLEEHQTSNLVVVGSSPTTDYVYIGGMWSLWGRLALRGLLCDLHYVGNVGCSVCNRSGGALSPSRTTIVAYIDVFRCHLAQLVERSTKLG